MTLSCQPWQPESWLDLRCIRESLQQQENAIIFGLATRASLPLNPNIYVSGLIESEQSSITFLDWYINQREAVEGKIRRFQSPDEHQFSNVDPSAIILPPLKYSKVLHEATKFNVNSRIRKDYIEDVLKNIAFETPGQSADTTFGSTVVADYDCLTTISRRVHYGKFVAESKFLADRGSFEKAIKAKDKARLNQMITDEKVELQVLDRVESKTQEIISRIPCTGKGYQLTAKSVRELFEVLKSHAPIQLNVRTNKE